MKTFRNIAWILVVAITMITISCKEKKKPIDDKDLGLRKTSVFDEKNTTTPGVQYSKNAPGSGKRFDRAYENAPPQIPHKLLQGFLPITQSFNMCLQCHMPSNAKARGATPMPKSHFYDMRENKKLGAKDINKARYECVLCHVPQATNVKPLPNNFKPVFRSEKSKKSSNLMEVLNEGVK